MFEQNCQGDPFVKIHAQEYYFQNSPPKQYRMKRSEIIYPSLPIKRRVFSCYIIIRLLRYLICNTIVSACKKKNELVTTLVINFVITCESSENPVLSTLWSSILAEMIWLEITSLKVAFEPLSTLACSNGLDGINRCEFP